MSKSAPSQKPAPQQQASECEAATPVARQAPPPPGMGKFVDKVA